MGPCYKVNTGFIGKYPNVFDNDTKHPIKDFKASINIHTNANPIFSSARRVSYALEPKISHEIDRLEKLEKIQNSECASLTVNVVKKDGLIKICGDYKITINLALNAELYPLPTPEDLFTCMKNGKYFTKLDLSFAYLQLEVDEKYRKYLTINTHKGLYQYTRLNYRINCAPAIFQKLIDQILMGLPGFVCYINDILICGESREEHDKRLEEVLRRLDKHNVKVKADKCEFSKTDVSYLGHLITADGIKPLTKKTKAITECPSPSNVDELRSWLGLINYYSKFIKNLSSLIHPLNELLKKNARFIWSEECNKAFIDTKKAIILSKCLMYYDVSLPISISCNASGHGIEAVLCHILEDGLERLIMFVSKSLTNSEKNYSHMEKEALSIIFAVKKFHRYIYGKKFTIVTDNSAVSILL